MTNRNDDMITFFFVKFRSVKMFAFYWPNFVILPNLKILVLTDLHLTGFTLLFYSTVKHNKQNIQFQWRRYISRNRTDTLR